MKLDKRVVAVLVVAAGLAVAAVVRAAERATELQHKAHIVEETAKAWLKKGDDPSQAVLLMRKAKESFDKGDANQGERYIDDAMVVLGLKTGSVVSQTERAGRLSNLYEHPQQIEIAGYNMDSMEPCISLDGKYLFFNNTNEIPDTHLYAARRVGDTKFEYIGPVKGARFTPADSNPSWEEREMAPTVDSANQFFFTAIHSYPEDMRTFWVSHWHTEAGGKGVSLTDKKKVEGPIAPDERPWVDMDAGVSPDGKLMVFSRAKMVPGKNGPAESFLTLAKRRSDDSFEPMPNSKDLLKNVSDAKMLQYAPAVTNDGLELYYTQCEIGAPIFRTMVATRKSANEPFDKPSRLAAITGFAEAPSLTADKHELFFHKNVAGRFRIFRVTRNEKVVR